MSKRARKERRERRNAEQAAPSPATPAVKRRVEKGPVRAVTAPARGATFDVAAAHRRLADDLPSVVHQRSKAPPLGKSPARKFSGGSEVRDTQYVVSQTAAKPPPSREKPGLKMEKPPETACKAKPKATSGDGRSRGYVPWCK